MPDEPVPDDPGLRAVADAKDAEFAGLRAELGVAREVIHRLGLRLAELEQRLDMGSGGPETPSSRERTGANEDH